MHGHNRQILRWLRNSVSLPPTAKHDATNLACRIRDPLHSTPVSASSPHNNPVSALNVVTIVTTISPLNPMGDGHVRR